MRLGASQTIDIDTDEVVEQNATGQLDYYESELVSAGNVWKVKSVTVRAEGVATCSAPNE